MLAWALGNLHLVFMIPEAHIMILTWLISDLVAWRWRDIPNNTDLFVAYSRNARLVEPRLLPFFKAPILSQNVLSQVLMDADQQKLGYLGRQEFYNALKLDTVAQIKRDLTPDMINAALYGPASAKIPAPQINLATVPTPQSNLATLGTPGLGNVGVNHQHLQSQQNQVMRPTQAMPSSISSQTEQVLAAQGMLMGGNIVAPRLPTSNSSTNWQSRNSGWSYRWC
ncbi:RalBP1-associated Eps domain-containing 1 [Gossypium arboreum]|uniref:RalBP1-associated Eps domain-containing 1 n=1 Tax=Gossypium arboreum TaxID=29729 RepID=A0A0B0NF64_GOSAR|nr:RalBP1-associated Eps domain-containing 1 [Gossypium arboreum]